RASRNSSCWISGVGETAARKKPLRGRQEGDCYGGPAFHRLQLSRLPRRRGIWRDGTELSGWALALWRITGGSIRIDLPGQARWDAGVGRTHHQWPDLDADCVRSLTRIQGSEYGEFHRQNRRANRALRGRGKREEGR